MDRELDLETINAELEVSTPEAVLHWAWEQFAPGIAATSSFQTQSLPLLHMIATTVPEMPVYFMDTGFHFGETLAFRDELMARFGVNVRTLTPVMGHADFRRQHGDLYRANPDLCCYINKVEPWQQVKGGLDAWISGIRRDQTADRRETRIVSQARSGQYKVCPLATWTDREVWRYINRHDLPVHPLFSQGYLSIGCAPCTRPVDAGEDARTGRWAGQAKTECGLHIDIAPPPTTD
jgi:phosphoadenosine phosphosulfate reductase